MKQSDIKNLNYWKILSFILLFFTAALLITLQKSAINNGTRKEKYKGLIVTPVLLKTPTPTPIPPPRPVEYQSNVWNTQGTTTIDYSFSSGFFELIQTKYNFGETTNYTFQVPLTGMDSASDPKISHDGKYGCVTIGASGYWGYFIFTLPEGNEIEKGRQYSQCIEWIDDNRVIITENIYDEHSFQYYIYNASTKSRTLLSSFPEKLPE